jgi:hypothetical protein
MKRMSTSLRTHKGIVSLINYRATIPPRIISHRAVAASCFLSFVMCMGFFTHIYYVPFYFQAAKSFSAEASGVRLLPYLISNAFATFTGGFIISKTAVFIPFAWLGTSLFAVGSALIYTLKVNSNASEWISYQILTGAAYGLFVQIPLLAIQNTLPQSDVAVGSALFFFSQSLGGSIGISVAQNIFSNALEKELRSIDGVDVAAVNKAGATGIHDAVPRNLLKPVIQAYNYALTRAYVLPIAVGCAAFFGSLLLGWKRLGDQTKKDTSTEESNA